MKLVLLMVLCLSQASFAAVEFSSVGTATTRGHFRIKYYRGIAVVVPNAEFDSFRSKKVKVSFEPFGLMDSISKSNRKYYKMRVTFHHELDGYEIGYFDVVVPKDLKDQNYNFQVDENLSEQGIRVLSQEVKIPLARETYEIFRYCESKNLCRPGTRFVSPTRLSQDGMAGRYSQIEHFTDCGGQKLSKMQKTTLNVNLLITLTAADAQMTIKVPKSIEDEEIELATLTECR